MEFAGLPNWNRPLSTDLDRASTIALPQNYLTLSPQLHNRASSLIVIDPTMPNYQQLIAGLQPDSQVLVLDPVQDAIDQITQTLLGQSGISSLHLISHGTSGGIQLGGTWLDRANLDRYQSEFQRWAKSLTEDADILIYGCDVAQGEVGQAFIQHFSRLTGADIAASDDLTGNASLNGDWMLEVNTGEIASTIAFNPETQTQYSAILPVDLISMGNPTLVKGSVGLNDIGRNAASGDGQFVVFTSSALISPNDANGTSDVFLYDRTTERVTLISRNATNTGSAAGASFNPVISFDGNYVAFISDANDLVASMTGNTTQADNIFVWERSSGNITLVSRNADGTSGIEDSSAPSISDDGSRIAFQTQSQLLFSDAGLVPDVYVWNRSQPSAPLIHVSRNRTGERSRTQGANSPVISGDGNYVAFSSLYTNLSFGDTNRSEDIFLWQASNDTVVNLTPSGDANSINPVISQDGSRVAFVSTASRFATDTNTVSDVFAWTRTGVDEFGSPQGTIQLVSVNSAGNDSGNIVGGFGSNAGSQNPIISRNGNAIAFTSSSSNLVTDDANNAIDVFVRNLTTNQTALVSRSSSGAIGNDASGNASLNADGTRIAFTSLAMNLVNGDTNNQQDVFVRDTSTNTTFLISRTSTGGVGNNASGTIASSIGAPTSVPIISNDGSTVTFVSLATNLTAEDSNALFDGFIIPIATGNATLISRRDNNPDLVSRTGSGSSTVGANSVSEDGRFIVFTSAAPEVVDGDTNGVSDVFLRDRQTGKNTLISRGSAIANGASGNAIISANGNYIVFTSAASNLVAGDTNNQVDLFWVNRQTGEIRLVSQGANAPSLNPVISADGLVVAFTSTASNLVAGDTNGLQDVFVWNSANNSIVQISRGDGVSEQPVISQDGRYVAFISAASNLVAGDTNGRRDVFVWDRNTSALTLVSRSTNGTLSDGDSSELSISSNGRKIAFTSTASNLIDNAADADGDEDVFVRDLDTNTTIHVSVNQSGGYSTVPQTGPNAGFNARAFSPVISGNGEFVVFTSDFDDLVTGDANGANDIFRRNLAAGTTQLVSVNRSGTASGSGTPGSDGGTGGGSGKGSSAPSITRDGRFVVFNSFSNDLAAGDTNDALDVFVRDMLAGVTTLVSQNPDETNSGRGASFNPVISGNGSYIAFNSLAPDLTIRDLNGASDVFGLNLASTVSISLSKETIEENSPNETVQYRIRRNRSVGDVTVRLAIDPASTAMMTSDYTFSADPSLNLSFNGSELTIQLANGVSEGVITLAAVNDVEVEAEETLNLSLVATPDYAVSETFGTTSLRMIDNDVPVLISIENITTDIRPDTKEGDSGEREFTFQVKLDPTPITAPVTVRYATQTVTADGSDFVETSGELTFDIGVDTQTITVLVKGDTQFEQDETFNVVLSNPSTNARIAEGTASAKIENDDTAPIVTIAGAESIVEGDSNTQDYTFTVTLSETSSTEVKVDYAIRDLTTTGDVDYVALPNGTLTFAAGQTTQTITLQVRGDRSYEFNEQFQLELLNPVGAILSEQSSITGTIIDNDTAPTITIEAVPDQSEGTTSYPFTVKLSEASGRPVTVNYETIAGTAIAGEDFTANSGTLTIAPGQTTGTIPIAILNDTIREQNESFSVRLSNPTDATITTETVTATIVDDDPIPTVSIANVSKPEGNSGNTPLQFEVTLSNASDREIVLNYATKDGTATLLDNDYEQATGTIRFAPGTTSQIITVNAKGDTKREQSETFSVELTTTTPTLVTIPTTAIGVGTIETDDSTLPTLSVSPVSVSEGGVLKFEISLSEVSDEPITVDVAIDDGTALKDDSDYTPISLQTLTFAPNQRTKTIEIQTTADNKLEPDETINLTLLNAVNATIAGTGTVIGTILNDDQRPTIAISSDPLSEDDPLAATYPFTIRLSNPTTQTVTVNYRTIDDTAKSSDNDYVAASGTVTFNPGEVEKTIRIQANADRKFEPTERFIVHLENAVNAGLSDTATDGYGVLNNDDAKPELSIAPRPGSRTEGNSGKTPFEFVVTLNNPSSEEIRVNYTTVNDTAISGQDYDAKTGTLVFAPGVEEQIITIEVNGDTDFESLESFLVRLSDPSGAKLSGSNEAQGTIPNDDGAIRPTIQIDDVIATEGSTDKTYTFKVKLSQATTNTVTVQYRTLNGTNQAGNATIEDNDYIGVVAPQTLTFAPGDIEKEISIVVRGDTKFEQNETFFVELLNPTEAVLPVSRARGVINNDDAQPTISIGNVAVSEGTDGFTNATFAISLSNSSDQAITVDYTTVDGTARVNDNDYETASGKLTFAPGTTTQQITVKVQGDRKFELDEAFSIRLFAPTNAILFDAPNQGIGTILSDDFRPTISIDDTSLLPVQEGNSGNTSARFVVRLSNPSTETVTVNYITRNGTATETDYTAVTTPTILTFNPGQTEQTINLQIIGDTRLEPDETFTIELSDPTNGQLMRNRTTATIRNDDPVPQLSIAAVPTTQAEGNSGLTPFTFEITLSEASYLPITVNYSTTDGTATLANNDYVRASDILTFAPGETRKTITVNVLGDTQFEGNETFQVTLNNPSNASIRTNSAIATITEDDTPDNTDNSDSLYDILWRNRRTGENMLWMPSGTFLDREIPLTTVPDPLWKIVTTTDFDNDGVTDLLWRNSQTGENAIWRTNENLTFTETTLASVDGDWEIAGVGDFNGDRSPDLFWRNVKNGGNVVWLLRGMTPFFGAETAPVVQPGWQIKTIADFDNDGKADLFWSNQSNGATALWLMDGTTQRVGRSLGVVPDVLWQVVSAGDLNRDGFADLIWRHGRSGENVVWLMENGWVTRSVNLPSVPDSNWQIEQLYDFNADQNLDVLWRQSVSQETVIWFLNREQAGTAAFLPNLPDRNWQIEGVGKFGNQSKGEIFLRNAQTGEQRLWRIHRDLFNRTQSLDSQSLDWEIQGTADFDQNGSADILWRNLRTRELSIWLIENDRVLNKVSVPAGVVVPSDWKIIGIADFSADGSPDILWRNQANGGNALWLFKGTQVVDGFELASVDTGWRIEGIADLNGDRNPDLIWRHAISGEIAYWQFDRTQVRYGAIVGTVPTNWQIKEFADFNRDGKTDLLWRSDVSNETTIWFMNGAQIAGGLILPSAIPTWDIMGVGDYNLDNQLDILWRDRTNGTNTVWYLSEGRFLLSNFIEAVRDIDWQAKDINDF
ncbi:Calx-beta domain-containing protein [Leptolyngbya sp. NIES-2104]|uniref:Calx-beta domain-containing protein n=1 Tax=Leptolyngbya sp. NIES-2104 TaxID=1552121 RepID=UPI0006EC555B|nr:Calx-beta domain-containing protein [Leptolyngbya sp. NIES-2104]GAP97340.1 alkaline phosphatase [Leptolyngbya sp. NIES-2104]